MQAPGSMWGDASSMTLDEDIGVHNDALASMKSLEPSDCLKTEHCWASCLWATLWVFWGRRKKHEMMKNKQLLNIQTACGYLADIERSLRVLYHRGTGERHQ